MKVGLIAIVLLSITKCVAGKFEGFIVGGHKVKNITDYPHVAFLSAKTAMGQFICGSSILNQWILLTAAHCVNGIRSGVVSVGHLDRDEGVQYLLHKYKVHEKWNEPSVTCDVAVYKVRKPIKFGPTVKRVIMMKRPPKEKKGVVTGWGATVEGYFSPSKYLKRAEQVLWDHKTCQKKEEDLPRGTICGGGMRSTSFASDGDSGGGLVVQKKIIVGLVSYKNSEISDSLVIYTDVAYYYDWIKKAAEDLARVCKL